MASDEKSAAAFRTIGEVAAATGVAPHVLRYWETEFPTLNPVKRRGNRRYYQRHEVLMVRQIRVLLYEQGYTIGGARLRLEGEAVRDALLAVRGHEGAEGTYNFDKNGDGLHGYNVVRNDKGTIVFDKRIDFYQG